jgi:DNA polymerase III sliding clamp (beta) subunit (PCNA family)
MKNFELFEDKIQNVGIEYVEENGGYITFVFRDNSVFEVLGIPTKEYPGYTDIQIKKLQ